MVITFQGYVIPTFCKGYIYQVKPNVCGYAVYLKVGHTELCTDILSEQWVFSILAAST